MNAVTQKNKQIFIYTDSFKKRKHNPGWKERGEIKEREEIYSIIYKDLLIKLFNFSSSIVIGGPSNEEVQYIKELENKYTITIFEPNPNRVKELEDKLKQTEIIRDYIFNIEKYIKPNSVDCTILLNIINWIPTNLKNLLRGLYNSLRYRGKTIISFYVDLLPNSKDSEYIVETPSFFKDSIERCSMRNYSYCYHDANGILRVYVLDKKCLKSVLEDVEKEEHKLRKILEFLTSLN